MVTRIVLGQPSQRSALAAVGITAPTRSPLSGAQKALVERLKTFAEGEPEDFSDVLVGTNSHSRFQRRVIDECRRIRWGTTISYKELAVRSGHPSAARAVGNVMAHNPTPLVVPCHRVIGASGSLGGFSAPTGTAMKQRLLRHEGVLLAADS